MERRLLQARWMVPVCQPPIENGWVEIFGDRIVAVGHPPADRQAVDLGDVALFPGLVNAHTHLEFSHLTAPLGRMGDPLPQWLAAVVAQRRNAQPLGQPVSEHDRTVAIRSGHEQSNRAGVVLLGEILTPPWQLSLSKNGPQVVAFVEALGLSPIRADESFQAARHWLQLCGRTRSCGISPHAPYSVSLDLLRRCVSLASELRLPVAMHVAESLEELRLLRYGDGPFRKFLRQVGAWQPGHFPVSGGILTFLKELACAPRSLIVHGNYLPDEAIDFLASQPHMSVIYCPRTHAYFQHQNYPLAKLSKAGIRVALGTDSLASNPDLNLWREFRQVLSVHPWLAVSDALQMVTLTAAEALGRADFGRLAPGCVSRLLCIPSNADTVSRLWRDFASADTPKEVTMALPD